MARVADSCGEIVHLVQLVRFRKPVTGRPAGRQPPRHDRCRDWPELSAVGFWPVAARCLGHVPNALRPHLLPPEPFPAFTPRHQDAVERSCRGAEARASRRYPCRRRRTRRPVDAATPTPLLHHSRDEKLAIAISFESRRSESDRGLIRQALQREGGGNSQNGYDDATSARSNIDAPCARRSQKIDAVTQTSDSLPLDRNVGLSPQRSTAMTSSGLQVARAEDDDITRCVSRRNAGVHWYRDADHHPDGTRRMARHGRNGRDIVSRWNLQPVSFASIAKPRSTPAVMASRRFCINAMHRDHHALMSSFTKPECRSARFQSGPWRLGHNSIPFLENAQSNIFCEMFDSLAVGNA